ncbi:exodeoxyribonuclease III [Halorhodospira halophila]|uniref:Exodeoxyribonuclease III n=1 Tax=Halorhodospira halophila (strain DSM 244 / SL1) TaxID=349124 RepID=A1WZD5_HALHL|nr:exodeoxyribonuclease III [Halorhodospira halophila]ABM63047.1 Exodeoxyribonuclease III [Halorhodospira halophila SL1]MBK1727832.1 exodeoxyribonuclease III [Halorhodospira halophila]
MKIASWNVNSLKVRLPQVKAWAQSATPSVIALQETKVPDDQFPLKALQEAGYRAAFAGQRTYNGVAVLARSAPQDVVTDLPGFADTQRRVLACTVSGVRVINLYVPNGQEVGSEKYGYKLRWLEALHHWVARELEAHEHVVVLGDFNIAPQAADVHDPAEWEGKVLFSQSERDALRGLLNLGLVDTFRLFEQPEGQFSWWDYRVNSFKRNRGLRIDLILASSALARACVASRVDVEPRRWERPSDHAPVVAEFDPVVLGGAEGERSA